METFWSHYIALVVVVFVGKTKGQIRPDEIRENVTTVRHYDTNDTIVKVTFYPEKVVQIFEKSDAFVRVNVSGILPAGCRLHVTMDDSVTVELDGATVFLFPDSCITGCHMSMDIHINGKRLGKTHGLFQIKYCPLPFSPEARIYHYDVDVLRPREPGIRIQLLITIVFLVLLTFGFGCQLEIAILIEITKKPIPPLIGCFCQFVVMPLLGFGLSMAFSLAPAFGFGLLTYSCSPGGGHSNVFAALLGGDITLSLMMTFLSTLLSLGTMPLWMYVLGRYFIDPNKVMIPYLTIVKTLLYLVVPCLVGILVNKLFPKLGKKIVILTKYLSGLFILFAVVSAAWVNSYIFTVLRHNPILLAPVLLLPVCGFSVGYVIAYICKQPHYRSLTVALETGIQNVGIPLIMLQFAFFQPEGDLGAVMPLAAAYCTTLPLQIILIIYKFYHMILDKKRRKEEREIQETSDDLFEEDDQNEYSQVATTEINGKIKGPVFV